MMQQWFKDGKFGISMHWGLYAVKGITESWSFYRGMISYEDYMKQCEGFTASKFLLNNQEEAISREAADLINERYQLSKGNQMTQSEEELKVAYISRLLLDYKNAIVEEELKQCNADLTRPEVKNDIKKTMDIMQRIKDLCEIQRRIAKYLGDRVVMK